LASKEQRTQVDSRDQDKDAGQNRTDMEEWKSKSTDRQDGDASVIRRIKKEP
jgi:hypothetical protein